MKLNAKAVNQFPFYFLNGSRRCLYTRRVRPTGALTKCFGIYSAWAYLLIEIF